MLFLSIVSILIVSFNLGGSNKFINLLGSGSIGGSIGGGSITRKVWNTFGTSLGRDIDGNGDNDAAAIFNNVAGGNGNDSGNSMYVDSSVYVIVRSRNASGNYDYVCITYRVGNKWILK